MKSSRLSSSSSLSRGKGLKGGRGFAVSKEQREKVAGMSCAGCGMEADDFTAIDPAHLCARSLGGCDDPLCVVPLCRFSWSREGCHDRFDAGDLDLTPKLEPRFREEVAHCVLHMGLWGAVRRLSGERHSDPKRKEAA